MGDSGDTVVPAFSFHLGVPPAGDVSVRVTQVSSHVEQLTCPLRVRTAAKTGPRYPGRVEGFTHAFWRGVKCNGPDRLSRASVV